MLINPEGTISAIYRKMHLFDVDVPGGKRFRESDTVEPGADVVVAPTPWGGLGLSICYDLRFPELYRAHAAQGARIIAVPSAFTLETGKDHWHVLLRARAIENQVYVMAPAQFGTHGPTRRSYGHALVVDPWGVIVAECGDQEGFALARLDFAHQDKLRAALPCLTHRRAREPLAGADVRRAVGRLRLAMQRDHGSAADEARDDHQRRPVRDAEAVGEQHLRAHERQHERERRPQVLAAGARRWRPGNRARAGQAPRRCSTCRR